MTKFTLNYADNDKELSKVNFFLFYIATITVKKKLSQVTNRFIIKGFPS